MEKIAIIGAGGFGREVKTLIDSINQSEKRYDLIGFFDDHPLSKNIMALSLRQILLSDTY